MIIQALAAEQRGFYEHDNAGFARGGGIAIGIVSHETRLRPGRFSLCFQ
jgi:hypothetical protein